MECVRLSLKIGRGTLETEEMFITESIHNETEFFFGWQEGS